MLDGWDTVHVAGVSSDTGSAELGTDRTVTVDVDLGALTTDDVDVQLLHGPAGAGDELIDPEVVSLAWSGTDGVGSGVVRYEGGFRCERAGRYGFTVRVVPSHPGLTSPVELGSIAWA